MSDSLFGQLKWRSCTNNIKGQGTCFTRQTACK